MRGKKYLLSVLCLLLAWTTPVMADSTTISEKVTQIVNEVITTDMSQLDKASALHDWLTDHAYYDLTFSNYGPEGVLLHGTGVCQSYSEAYKLLLAEAGIESHVLTGHARKIDGTMESHAWNLVKIDGKWKHVDVTWDDPVNESGPNNVPLSGLEQHMYFMVNTSTILTDHIPDEKSAAILQTLVGNEVEEALPAPVNTKPLVEVPDFTFTMKDGTVLTKTGFGKGRKLIMVYGRTTCLNTTFFLSEISGYVSQLKNSGVTVLAALFDNPSDNEIKEMESRYPGVVCARVGSDDNSMWDGLYDLNMTDSSVIFPVIFLKNAKDAVTYCSVGFVEEPLTIVAGALNMNGDAAPKAATTGTADQALALKASKKYSVSGIVLSNTNFTYNGKVQKPKVTVKYGNKALPASNYELTWSKGCLNPGTYKVTARMKGKYTGTLTASFKIKPKGTVLKKLTPGSKKITVSWKKQSKMITGYQIQYSLKSNFKKAKTVTVKGAGKTRKVIKKLKKGKKYFVRIRTYKTAGGKKYYSSWSKTKRVKVK